MSLRKRRVLLAAAAVSASMLVLPPGTAFADTATPDLEALGEVAAMASDAEDGWMLLLTGASTAPDLKRSNTLEVRSAASYELQATIALEASVRELAYDAGLNRAYVTDADGWITAIDVAARQILTRVHVGGYLIHAAAAGGKVFVADAGTYTTPGSLRVLDAELRVQRTVAVPGGATAVAVTPDGGTVYVNDQSSVTVHRSPLYDSERVGTVWGATRMRLSPDAQTLYVGSQGDAVVAFDAATHARRDLPVNGAVWDVELSANGSRLLAAQPHDGKVSVLDVAAHERVGVVGVPAPLRLHRIAGTDTTFAWSDHGTLLTRINPSPAPSPLPRVSPADGTVAEGDPYLALDPAFADEIGCGSDCEPREERTHQRVGHLVLDRPSPDWVEVSYRFGAPGSATAGVDYYEHARSVLIPPGVTTQPVSFTVYGDTTEEPDETLTLEVVSAVGATVGDTGVERSAVITILAEDAVFTDADRDGIEDSVDSDGGVSISPLDFSDVGLGGGTAGTVTSPTDGSVRVADAGSPDGVHIAYAAEATTTASIQMCGYTVQMSPGTEQVATCGSIELDVVQGLSRVVLGDGSTAVDVPAGVAAKIDEGVNGGWTVDVLSAPESTGVTVTVDGATRTLYEDSAVTTVQAWDFVGFEQPVRTGDAGNTVKAGRVVPLKWRILDHNAQPVTDLAAVTVTFAGAGSCGGSAVPVEQRFAGSSGLQNLGAGNYQVNWKTPSVAGCGTMTMDIGDGSEHAALFRLN